MPNLNKQLNIAVSQDHLDILHRNQQIAGKQRETNSDTVRKLIEESEYTLGKAEFRFITEASKLDFHPQHQIDPNHKFCAGPYFPCEIAFSEHDQLIVYKSKVVYGTIWFENNQDLHQEMFSRMLTLDGPLGHLYYGEHTNPQRAWHVLIGAWQPSPMQIIASFIALRSVQVTKAHPLQPAPIGMAV